MSKSVKTDPDYALNRGPINRWVTLSLHQLRLTLLGERRVSSAQVRLLGPCGAEFGSKPCVYDFAKISFLKVAVKHLAEVRLGRFQPPLYHAHIRVLIGKVKERGKNVFSVCTSAVYGSSWCSKRSIVIRLKTRSGDCKRASEEIPRSFR